MNIKYDLLLKKSWRDLKNNLIVFLPLVFSLILILFFILLAILEIFMFLKFGFDFKSNLINSITYIVVAGFIDIILILFFGSFVDGMYLGLLKAVITKNKAVRSDMWKGMRSFAYIIFRVNLLRFLIVFLPLILLGGLSALGFLVSKNLGIGLAIFFGFIYLLYFMVIMLFFAFGLFFLNPIISLEKGSSVVALMKQSFRYSKENLSHLFITWAIVLGIGLAFNSVNYGVGIPIKLMPFYILIPISLLLVVVKIIVDRWMKLFVFNAYFNSKIKKL